MSDQTVIGDVADDVRERAVRVLHADAHAGGWCPFTAPESCPDLGDAHDIVQHLVNEGFVITEATS
jgi:hypothetical protein